MSFKANKDCTKLIFFQLKIVHMMHFRKSRLDYIQIMTQDASIVAIHKQICCTCFGPVTKLSEFGCFVLDILTKLLEIKLQLCHLLAIFIMTVKSTILI